MAIKRVRDRWIASGLCGMCGKRPPVDGIKNCQQCRESVAKYEERRAYSPEAAKTAWNKNREVRVKQQKALRVRVKTEVVNGYGGACTCCGEDNLVFLTLDHINGDGAERRRQGEPKGGDALYRWAIKNKFPDDLQVLCYNCNCAKRDGEVCPHQLGASCAKS